MTRGLKILYVENDQALLGLLGQSLSSHPAIETISSATSSDQAFELASRQQFDAALLDISLGPNSISGIELALSLREKNEHLGIVLLSQHIGSSYLTNLPQKFGYGWSAIQKSASLSVDYLVQVLQATANGLNVSDPSTQVEIAEDADLASALNSRQRQVIGLAATGLDAPEIAKQLTLAPVTVRQELSKCYKILVPNPKPGTDLRTTAVLRYLRESRRLD